MFSNKIDTHIPLKEDKLKASSSNNFDFDGEGFSSMLENEENVSGKLRETDAEIREDESILSTDHENRTIARQRSKAVSSKNIPQPNPNIATQIEKDARSLLKLMDMTTKANLHAINITKSKKELENLSASPAEIEDDLVSIIAKIHSRTDVQDGSQESLSTEIDLGLNDEKMSDSSEGKEQNVLHETQEELLEDLSILSTDEENLAMVNKANDYEKLTDEDFQTKDEDIEFLTELKSIHNQARVEIRDNSQQVETLSVTVQAHTKPVVLKASELNSADVDYVIAVLKSANDGTSFHDDEYPSELSAKFLIALKESLANKKVFRIDFDNDISVIIKIDMEGKISANFLTSNKEIEEGLKNNLYLLRQKFDEQGILYSNVEYTSTDVSNSELDIEKVIATINSANTNQEQMEH